MKPKLRPPGMTKAAALHRGQRRDLTVRYAREFPDLVDRAFATGSDGDHAGNCDRRRKRTDVGRSDTRAADLRCPARPYLRFKATIGIACRDGLSDGLVLQPGEVLVDGAVAVEHGNPIQ